ncbi:MAG: hypothetical protein EPO27_10570 [Betaproteobacteria bacterium]|nr:MAG: hypothetical protein EPO27_10570 [Betaproteobacteria bacterium]
MTTCTAAWNQKAFRGRNDNGDQATATWKANQNVNWTQAVDENFRVRFEVQETAACAGNNKVWQLQYNLNAAGWVTVNGASNVVRSTASPNVADAANLTDQLTAGTGTFQGATGFDEANGAAGGNSMDVAASGHAEAEFCVQILSADVANNDTVQLRITDNGTAFAAYDATPSITVSESLPEITGTGALPAQAAAADGTGVSASSGTGALAAQAAAADGTGEAAWTGTGALAAQSAPAAGAGISASTGSGALAAQASTSAGAGVSLSTGTGALAAQAAAAAGAGISASTGSGALAAQSASSAGAGVSASTGSGALAAQAASAAGTGTAGSASVTGTGALAAQAAAVAAIGVSASIGAGALAAGGAAIAGVGTAGDAVVVVPSGTRPGLLVPILRLPLQCLAEPIRTRDEWGVATADVYTPGEAGAIAVLEVWGDAAAELPPLECVASAVNDDEDWGDFRGARQPPRHEMYMALLDRRAA